jgi:uncharacterized cupredoxin-like copper-binding protein
MSLAPRTPARPTLRAFAIPFVVALAVGAAAMTPADPDNIAVVVTDNSLELPDTIVAGPTTFEVTNRGTNKHSFALARDGGEAEADLDAELGPGESATLEFDLKEGQYSAYCPMDGHKETLSARFVVVAERVSN